MRILIADDQVGRYGRLIDNLTVIGVNRDQIDLVSSANAARDHLKDKSYDLLLLDILLPPWPENRPESSKYSLDLLCELHEGDECIKPRHIIGITGDKSALAEAEANFEMWTWSIVEYSPDREEWVDNVVNCVRYILDNERTIIQQRPMHCVDLVVICALEKPELEEVLKLPWHWSPSRPIDDMTFVSYGYFRAGERTITVAATAAPRMGMVSTALLSATLISLLRPRLIAMCGVCAGVRHKVKMGDVLFADPSWDFQSGKRVKDVKNTSFSIAPHQIHANPLVRNHVQQIRSDSAALLKIYSDFGSDAPSVPAIHMGPVASGSAVLADGEVINEIKAQHRDLVGIEMEVYGLYAAASAASQPQPRAFALKSVCDFADPQKEDGNQRYAAYTSANVLRLLMEKYGHRLLD